MNQIDPAYIICQKSSLTRLHQRVQELNDAAPRTRFSRNVNGQTVQLERRHRVITGNEEATMERIIKDFIRDYHIAVKTLGPAALAEGVPPIRISRPGLAGRRTICEKTVYNHLSSLRNAGLITRYRFRGTRQSFEIWIDPTLLFQPERLQNGQFVDISAEAAQQLVNQALVTDSPVEPTANFTAYKVSIPQGNLETEIGKAVECEQGNAPESQQSNNQGNTEQPVPKNGDSQVTMWQSERQTPIEKPSGGGAGTRLKARMTKQAFTAKIEADRTPEQRKAIQLGFVRSFWKYAQDLLYPERQFTDLEQTATLNAIFAGVYNCFNQQMSETEWDAYQADLYRRLELAATYYRRHQDKWVPMPFGQFRPGTGYFDAENLRGFSQTEYWLIQNRQAQAKSYNRRRVNLAIRHLRLHKVDPTKSPKLIRGKTYIDAYRTLEAQMKAISSSVADLFRHIASTLDQQKPTLTKGFTKNFSK